MHRKRCCKCQKQRLVKFFHKRTASADGLYSYCKTCKQQDDKTYTTKYRDKVLEKHKLYYIKNRDRIAKQKIEYQKKNLENRRKYKRKYERQRKKQDPVYKLIQNYKNRIYKAIKGVGVKSQSTIKLLGCTGEEFQIYIETKFHSGMGWHNQGKWHIDHIIPLSSAETLQEIEKLFHYTNCQPLWAKDNLSKSDKLIFPNA
jgi:hypothetical protein